MKFFNFNIDLGHDLLLVLLVLLQVASSTLGFVVISERTCSARLHMSKGLHPAKVEGPTAFRSNPFPGAKALATEAGGREPKGLEGEEADGDEMLEKELHRAMHTIAMDWDDDGGHTPRESILPTKVVAQQDKDDSPFAMYESMIEPPPCHTVYYSGRFEHFCWRQGRETVQLIIPVVPTLSKSDVRFQIKSKTQLYLVVGDKVIFDHKELAQPIFTETSYWYFEKPDEEHKAVVVELYKKLDYSNWPRLFPEDADHT